MAASGEITTLEIATMSRHRVPVLEFDPFMAPEVSGLNEVELKSVTPGQVLAAEDPDIKAPLCHQKAVGYAVLAVALRTDRELGTMHVLDHLGNRRTIAPEICGQRIFASSDTVSLTPLSTKRALSILEFIGTVDYDIEHPASPLLIGLRSLATHYSRSIQDLRNI